ncbi:hypothetical protein Pyn_35757 [Prunus yedoensis var. nudiflora]|uniref:Uncharacterized protein n=1 Tax=Prunus yedoensis var. nudiflora TaxID=2094558 RepID=A0A314YUZ3_PRUYE|nr:hypothetical protein Pyn_35757 [Prunus yedoensis var. nudiflora]
MVVGEIQSLQVGQVRNLIRDAAGEVVVTEVKLMKKPQLSNLNRDGAIKEVVAHIYGSAEVGELLVLLMVELVGFTKRGNSRNFPAPYDHRSLPMSKPASHRAQ